MWTILGFQLCSVAVPTWVSGGKSLPKILVADETGNAPLCAKALKLKEKCLPLKRGSGKYYLNLAAVMNQDKNGILQKLRPLEDKILYETKATLKKWRKQGMILKQIQQFYQWLDNIVLAEYKKQYGL